MESCKQVVQLELVSGQAVIERQGNGLDHFLLEPETDLEGVVSKIRNQMQFDIFV